MSKESKDLITDNIDQIKRLFPEVVSEGKVNLERLKLVLGQELDNKEESYAFNWAGRQEAFKNIQSTAKGTLIPDEKASINFKETNNIFIEGDNLEVLKLLQKAYFNKVKMIYIDPPYNTGHDFVYKDNFKRGIKAYMEQTGQIGREGILLTTNPETGGRFHSNWISMMYPRLFLARNLMKDNGLIFVSIDEKEVHHLRLIMNEVFGEECFVTELIWNTRHSQQQGLFTVYHEYILVYAKSPAQELDNFSGGEGQIDAGAIKKISKGNPESEFDFPAGVRCEAEDGTEFRDSWGGDEKVFLKKGKFIIEDGKTKYPMTLSAGWTQKEQMKEYFSGKTVIDSKGQLVKEFYFSSTGKLKCIKERSKITPSTILDQFGTVSSSTEDLANLIGKGVFGQPKPVELIKFLIRLVTNNKDDDIIFDFFAGSGTTAQAALEQNAEDGGNRKFILIQLPELTPEKSEARKAGYKTIADICSERIRRVIKKINDAKKQNKLEKENVDLGFKVFKLEKSNYRIWENYDGQDVKELTKQLDLFKSPLISGYKDVNIIYECAIKEGLNLNATMEPVNIKENKIYKVSDDVQNFYISLDEDIKKESLDKLDLKKDDLFICLDSALNDSKKINISLQCKLKTL